MTLTETQVLARIERLSVTRLQSWIEMGCVRPAAGRDAAAYSEADLARLRLLCELVDDLAIDEAALPVVLSLLDQVHGLRRQLRLLAEAVEQQPAAVRNAVARHMRGLAER
ncbi:MAG: chaperone modulator CbpM [Alphaproteobacteria bacterium]